MRFYLVLACVLSAANAVLELSFEKRYSEMALEERFGEEVVDNTLRRRSEDEPNRRIFQRRQNVVTSSLENGYTSYVARLKVGYPSQSMDIMIDTGSADLWFQAPENIYCARGIESSQSCDSNQIFNYSASETFVMNESSVFNIAYMDSSYATGKYGSDKIQLGDAVLTNATFGLAFEANSTSVFGIGFPALESSTFSTKDGWQYDNVPQLLKRQGLIDTTSYSLFLNELASDHGVVLFGGVDHAKYHDPLVTVPLVNPSNIASRDTNEISAMNVLMTGLGWTFGDGSHVQLLEGAQPALLDSGTSLHYIPQSAFDAISRSLELQYFEEAGIYATSCYANASAGHLVYQFNEAMVNVSFSDLLTPIHNSDGTQVYFTSGEPACQPLFGVGNRVILGDSFLRSAYVVYDLDNYEISLATANFASKESDVESIGPDYVPSAIKANITATPTTTSLRYVASTNSFSVDLKQPTASSTFGHELSETDSVATSIGSRTTTTSTTSTSIRMSTSSTISPSSITAGTTSTEIGFASQLLDKRIFGLLEFCMLAIYFVV